MMSVIPKFIPADRVREKKGEGKEMYIKQFIRQATDNNLTQVYTRELVCYWFENGTVKKDVFHEDELELARQERHFCCYPSFL
jgi:uncharacterized protein YodC (DUF2158 family)